MPGWDLKLCIPLSWFEKDAARRGSFPQGDDGAPRGREIPPQFVECLRVGRLPRFGEATRGARGPPRAHVGVHLAAAARPVLVVPEVDVLAVLDDHDPEATPD